MFDFSKADNDYIQSLKKWVFTFNAQVNKLKFIE